jgi:hypothetical protein
MRHPFFEFNQRVRFKREVEDYSGPSELIPPEYLKGTIGVVRPMSPDHLRKNSLSDSDAYYVRAADQSYHLVHRDWLESA